MRPTPEGTVPPPRTARRPRALVTGASGGIGLELARVLADHGYDLVLVARNATRLDELATTLGDEHVIEVRAIPLDLARARAPEDLAAEFATGDAPDVLVNNAGFAMFGSFADNDLATELEMMQLNMITLTHLTKLLLPGMLARRSGKILNVASTAAFQPGPLMAVYYATKAYVLSFTEALAEELRGTGVSATALTPGPTASGFQSRANMEDSKLVRGRTIADAATVARAGYDGLMAGKTIVVPGWRNKAFAQAPRFAPRRLMTALVRNMQERTEG